MRQFYESKEPLLTDNCEDCQTSSMARDILNGLKSTQKYIPSKYFYDAAGSDLFEQICQLPEYYQTRIELKLLRSYAGKIVRGFGPGTIYELGAGSNRKIRALLDAIGQRELSKIRYVPVDVCCEAITKSLAELQTLYPALTVEPLIADFTEDLRHIRTKSPKLILFLGSTIGNLDENETVRFLKDVTENMNPGDRFLAGLDMVKPRQILEAAYNDSQGVTARFNKNVMSVINRELGANFEPECFEHVAWYNERHERIEMYLEVKKDSVVRFSVFGESFYVSKGERILTEICRKFRKPQVEKMISGAGMQVNRWYTDSNDWFSLIEAILPDRSTNSQKCIL